MSVETYLYPLCAHRGDGSNVCWSFQHGATAYGDIFKAKAHLLVPAVHRHDPEGHVPHRRRLEARHG